MGAFDGCCFHALVNPCWLLVKFFLANIVLNPALALLGQGLKKLPIGQKLDFANHPYLYKGLTIIKSQFLLRFFNLGVA
jgi:hypothetical protein